MTRGPRALLTVPAVLAGLVLSGCAAGGASSTGASGSTARTVSVRAGDSTCDVGASTLPAGQHTFAVENTSSQVSEVYVYAAGDRVVAEIEDIGPSTSRELVVELPAGAYQVACKPGMVGSGIRTPLRVTGRASAPGTVDPALDAAVAMYRRYVRAETRALVRATAYFTSAVEAGDAARARALYPTARLHYERIEPIAESFGTLDPRIDMRADAAAAGTAFTGFHRLERDLWQTRDITGSRAVATALDADVRKLAAAIPTVAITPLTMGNGAKALLDEVAKSKVTGEEERYSRIDLVDFLGNVEGAERAYRALRPVLIDRDPALASTLDARFRSLLALLATHRATGSAAGAERGGFVRYDALSAAQVRALAVEVDTLSEPLGRVTGVLVRS